MRVSLLTCFVLLTSLVCAQENLSFTQDEFLRGSITPEREWWDLTFYHLDIEVRPNEKFIQGKNTIRYKVLKSKDIMQIDLQPPLKIEKITQNTS